MDKTQAEAAREAKTPVTADYVGMTYTGTIKSVDVTGRDVLIEDRDGFTQWVPVHLVIEVK